MPSATQQSGTITEAWRSQDGVLMATISLGRTSTVSSLPYAQDPSSLYGRRVALVDGRWLLSGELAA